MAKQTGSTALADPAPPPTALAVVSPAREALAVNDRADLKDTRGKENIDTAKVRLPRIAIAQKTSPQLEDNKPEFIPDLKMFGMFNSMTGDVYGKGPLEFVVITERKRAMEFDKDNKVVDFDVPLNDPRLNFTVGPNGTRIKPVATLFYEFVVLLAESQELAVLSMSKTSAKTAADLEAFLAVRKGPAWAGKYSVSTVSKSFGSNTAGVFRVLPAGKTPDDLYAAAEGLYDFVKDAEVDTKGLEDDDVPVARGTAAPGDDQIPF